MGMFDRSITVRDTHGDYPIVMVLAKEPLYYLTERVKACDGFANVFVLDDDRVLVIHVFRTTQVSPDCEDFTDLDNGDSTIGAFIEYLRLRPNGVCIRSTLHRGEESRLRMGAQSVMVEEMPSMR